MPILPILCILVQRDLSVTEAREAIAKRRPRAQVRKLRGRGRPERTDRRSRPDFLTDEDLAGGERVVPRAARERSEKARSREDEPTSTRRTGELLTGEIIAFRGLLADVLVGPGDHEAGRPARNGTIRSKEPDLRASKDDKGGPLRPGGGQVYRCSLRGRLETADSEDRTLMVVGDRVELEPLDQDRSSASGTAVTEGVREGVIERMLPRRNVLLRAAPGTRRAAPPRTPEGQPAPVAARRGRSRHPRFRHVIAANVDRVLLITSAREPKFRPGMVDRFLVAAASQDIPASLAVNKMDLASTEKTRAEIDGFRALYESLGVEVVLTSAVDGRGLDELARLLAGCRTALVGHSGVGKSTLLNLMDPGLELPARPVNRKTGKGTHTTSVARLLRLTYMPGDPTAGSRIPQEVESPDGPPGATVSPDDAAGSDGPPSLPFHSIEVVDTPGIRELDIIDLAPSDLEATFPEFVPLLEDCEKDNCSHREEPGCAVKAAVESGEVHPRRYESYLAIFDSLMRVERPYAY